MPFEIDETHDPKLESWVQSANDPETDFPIQNLPLCVHTSSHVMKIPCIGVPIGDQLLDLAALDAGGTEGTGITALDGIGNSVGCWTDDAGIEHRVLRHELYGEIRRRLSRLLRKDESALRDHPNIGRALTPLAEATFLSPIERVGDYTDFYASLHHATNVGAMFRPDNPILPNYKWIPIGYHGRASSIIPSGTELRRPRGQLLPGATIDDGPPQFGPCKMLDYELEVGAVIGRGNELGRPIPMSEADDHIFGLCLVNDWSARDIQKWEYQPLGPFLAKSFATTISPYIVTMEALAPFRTPAFRRADGDPAPLPHLDSERNRTAGGVDITLEVYLQSEQMRARNMDPIRLSRGSFKDMYWTLGQMVAHHTSNGCNMQPGDLIASGTVSGPTKGSRGSMLELTWDGDPWATPPKVVPGTQRTPIKLPTGEERRFLADGDEVILKGYCEREGFRRIGFGECRGRVLPAE